MVSWTVRAAAARSRAGVVVLLGVVLIGMSMHGAGSLPAGPTPMSWAVSFEESTVEAGLDFRHAGEVHDPDGEDLGWPAFLEIMGGGACWADLTGDGFEDLYVTNQRFNDENPFAQGFNDLFDPTNAFYVNNGNGTFSDRTVAGGLESRMHDQGCSAVDYDADSHVDLLVYGFGHATLYGNNGDGTFTDMTDPSGVDRSTACLPFQCWHTCSAWVDYDGDGDLDFFLCTYVESEMDDDAGGPVGRSAQYNALFRNEGDGSFTEVAESAGVEGIAADAFGSKSLGALWFDADLDGWPDLYVANDMTPNEFYWNNGDGTFRRDDDAGLYNPLAGMGVTAGDYDRDGHPDLYFTHYQRQHNGFYENDGDGSFTDRSGVQGLSYDWDYVGWGTGFVDLDRDGFLDLVAANGHTAWPAGDEDHYGQPTLIFQQEPQQDGKTLWVNKTYESGPGPAQKRVTRGMALADHDLDGDVDIVLVNNANQTLHLLRGSGEIGRWLYVQPVQDGTNPQAIGARVTVETADGAVQSHEIRAGSSYLSQHSLLAGFGLGGNAQAERVTVHWPHGGTTVVEDVPADRVVRIDRETGGFITDTLSPVTTADYTGEHLREGWYRSEVEAVLAAADRAVGPESGVAVTEYRLNDGPWVEYEGVPFAFPYEEGEHRLDYRSVDQAGNVEPRHRDRIGIDLTPPDTDHDLVGTPASNGWWQDVELHLAASDALSGVRTIEYRVDDGAWTEYETSVPFDEGEHTVAYRALDHAGNVAPVTEIDLKVDATAPDAAVERPEPGAFYLHEDEIGGSGPGPAILVRAPDGALADVDGFLVDVLAVDDTSGIARVDLFLSGQHVTTLQGPGPYTWSWNTTLYPSGGYMIKAVAQDQAGHVALDSVAVILVNATPQGVLKTLEEGPAGPL